MRRTALFLLIALLLFIAFPGLCEDITFRITFAGDCTLGGEDYLRNTPASFDSLIGLYGIGYPFEKVQKIFQEDDYTLVNLECALTDSADGRVSGKAYNFRGPAANAEILKMAGIDGVTLGNNHSGDYGKQGIASTKDALKNAGIEYCLDKDVLITEIKGIRVAFIGMNVTTYNQSEDYLQEKIATLKAEEGCQYVVMLLHYGWEYSFLHNRKQMLSSHFVINCGADLVVGHHPHVVQGIEIYKNRLILYSLGNFSFGGNQTVKDKSLEAYMASVAVTISQGKLKSQQLTIFPVHTSGTKPSNNYQPMLVTGDAAQSVIDRMQGDTPFPLNPYIEGKGAVQDVLFADDAEEAQEVFLP